MEEHCVSIMITLYLKISQAKTYHAQPRVGQEAGV